jgi:putative protein kinase ArgK-like GTPase of G3E family
VVLAQGSNGVGVPELAQAIESHRAYRLALRGAEGMRKDRLRQVILNLVREELRVAATESLSRGILPGGHPLEPRLDAVVRGEADPFTVARDAVRRLFNK